MDEAEVLDDIGLDMHPVDEDSGSAYEATSSDADPNSSQDERPRLSRPSSTTSRRERGRSRSKRPISRPSDRSHSPREQSFSPQTKERIRAEGLQWAATFTGPQEPKNLKSSTRRSAGSQSKRKAEHPASQVRAKRSKGRYNHDYRELLNSVIHETASRSILDEYPPLTGSQIGSSLWTGEEKDTFFSALSRLGRDDARGIALRIRTKAELEVQEYIQLLQRGVKDREDVGQPLLDLTDLPAAFEISEECSNLLERAGDAVASRQEVSEEKAERNKWGESWLLTTDICTSLERQRRELGDESVAESLPAANLLDLKNWLELPERIFMNSGGPREDDNWVSFADAGETPAIRATAFEDFHALAVSITKRLMSTVLFCAMSRRRATHAMGIKHAEVVVDDVEAAVRILGLAENSLEFWIGSARRHSLDVYDYDDDSGLDVDLTYDEVETELRQTRRRSRSRSRSMSRQPPSTRSAASSVDARTDRDISTNSTAESLETNDDSLYDEDSDPLGGSSLDDDELADLSEGQVIIRDARVQEAKERKGEELKKARRAHDAYIEACDIEASQKEDQRLRQLLRQSSPLEIKPEPIEVPDRPKESNHETADVDWRDNIEYWSPWEILQTPVPEESFLSNRNRMSRRARSRIREESSGRDLSNEDRETLRDEAAGGEIDASSGEEDGEEEEETNQEGPADVKMNDDDYADLYSASQSEKAPSQPESQMSDDPFSSHLPVRTHRAQSVEEIAIRSDYEDG